MNEPMSPQGMIALKKEILSSLHCALPGIVESFDGTNEKVPAALSAQPGVTVTDNSDGTVTVSPAGVQKELLPVPAGVRVRNE